MPALTRAPADPASPAPPPPPLPSAATPFPWTSAGEDVKFSCRSRTYRCIIGAVEQPEEVGYTVVEVKTVEPTPKRPFTYGEHVQLVTVDGSLWSGEIMARQCFGEDVGDSMWPMPITSIWIRLPDQGDYLEEQTKFLHVYSVVLAVEESCNQLEDPWTLPTQQIQDVQKLKVGLNGFGPLGRLVAEVLLDSLDVDLVAICAELSVADMVRLWSNTKISLRLCNQRTLLFRRLNHPYLAPEDELLVQVFDPRRLEEISWTTQASVEIIVDSFNLVLNEEDDASDVDKNVLNCLTYFPKVVDAFGLRSDGHSYVPVKRLKIVVGGELVLKDVLECFPEWDGERTNMRFHASGRYVPKMRDIDLIVSLEKEPTDRVSTGKLAGAGSLTSVLGCCVDVIRRVPIDGCCVNLF